ncbi:ArsC/Spx/MgsR family protein [Lactococcus garvieae]
MRFGESLSFLERHTELLELPIVLSNEKAVSGYNEEQLKSFLL